MSFGLKTAIVKFQHVVDIILSSVKWQFTLVYPDDFLMFSKNPEEQINLTLNDLKYP